MVNHRYKRAVLGITTALVVSACTVPAMAAPITINTDQSISVVSTDSTYAGGLDLEARIITTVEQDQRSPYAKKGIAVTDDYLKIRTEPNKDADVVIIVGRHTDLITGKKVSVTLDRLKIPHDMQVICPIRSGKKFRAYVNTMKNAKIFIGINSNSSQVSGGLVGLTEKPVIGVPCENELGNNYLLSTVNMPPGVPVATVGVNNGRNAAVLSGEILSINNPVLLELLEKLKNKKINI